MLLALIQYLAYYFLQSRILYLLLYCYCVYLDTRLHYTLSQLPLCIFIAQYEIKWVVSHSIPIPIPIPILVLIYHTTILVLVLLVCFIVIIVHNLYLFADPHQLQYVVKHVGTVDILDYVIILSYFL